MVCGRIVDLSARDGNRARDWKSFRMDRFCEFQNRCLFGGIRGGTVAEFCEKHLRGIRLARLPDDKTVKRKNQRSLALSHRRRHLGSLASAVLPVLSAASGHVPDFTCRAACVCIDCRCFDDLLDGDVR